MNELIKVRQNEIFTTSKIIAEGTNNQHHAIREIIKKYSNEISEFGTLLISNEESSGGRPMEVFLLNEEQATFVITLLRNSSTVVKFKKELVRQFYQMRKFILEKQSEEWKASRQFNKTTRMRETEVIKLLANYAKEQGSTHSDKLYMTYTKLAKTVVDGDRNTIDIANLNTLTLVENIILQTIRIDMSMDMNYKDIYKDCKDRVERFKDIAYLNKRDEIEAV